MGDLIGRAGIEAKYEQRLRGIDGFEKTVVSAKGRRMRGMYVDSLLGANRRVVAQPGNNVFLTLDLDLQQAAEAAFFGRAGAVVGTAPWTTSEVAITAIRIRFSARHRRYEA